jgi:hypothetical protein
VEVDLADLVPSKSVKEKDLADFPRIVMAVG